MNADFAAANAVALQALLELIEADRDRQCGQILGEARARADALRDRARAEARDRLRRAFAEQRQRRQERVAAAQAQLATRRRLHEQQRSAALLRRAWAQWPAELDRLWHQPAGRAAWVARVLATAGPRLPRGEWRVVHAPHWPPGEREVAMQSVQGATGVEPVFQADAAITAGLKVMAAGNVVDGTLAGLLADRADFEARLLRQLEKTP